MPSPRRQRPAAGHRLPVGDVDDLVDLARGEQLGPAAGAEAGHVPGAGRPAEDHRTGGVDRDHVEPGEGAPQAAGEPEDRAGGADRHHETVERPVEVGQDLAGGAVVVGLPAALVGVLVDPDAVRQLPAQLRHPDETGVEVAAVVVGFGDELDPGPQLLEDPQVGRRGLRVDDAGEAEVVDPGGGGEGDAEVSRGALDQMAGGGDGAVGQAPLDDVGGRAVLHAAARVHQLQLGDDRRAGRRELPAQKRPAECARHTPARNCKAFLTFRNRAASL